DLTGGPEPVQPFHLNIHQHPIRTMPAVHLDCLSSVIAFQDDAGEIAEQPPEQPPHRGVVVDYQKIHVSHRRQDEDTTEGIRREWGITPILVWVVLPFFGSGGGGG